MRGTVLLCSLFLLLAAAGQGVGAEREAREKLVKSLNGKVKSNLFILEDPRKQQQEQWKSSYELHFVQERLLIDYSFERHNRRGQKQEEVSEAGRYTVPVALLDSKKTRRALQGNSINLYCKEGKRCITAAFAATYRDNHGNPGRKKGKEYQESKEIQVSGVSLFIGAGKQLDQVYSELQALLFQ